MLEAAQKLFFVIAMDVNAHGLQRYRASDVGIGSLIYDAHSAAPDFADDLVSTDGLWYRCVHVTFFDDETAIHVSSIPIQKGTEQYMMTGSQTTRICALFAGKTLIAAK